VILVVDVSEMGVAALQAFDRVAVFREFTQYGMMQVHGLFSWLKFV
jgi:hypothetical protein